MDRNLPQSNNAEAFEKFKLAKSKSKRLFRVSCEKILRNNIVIKDGNKFI